jgi:hypothetical protein
MAVVPRRTKTRESRQVDLFEQGKSDVELSSPRSQQLAALIEALMIEIATGLANREVGDDQDRR